MRKPVFKFFSGHRARRLANFKNNKRGVAAVEFAMVAPLMVMMFIGAVEFSQVITVDRRVSQVASSAADLVARTKEMTTSDMDGVMEVVEQIVKPYDHTLLKMTILNVAASATDETDTKVCWAASHNGGTGSYSPNQTYALPTGVVEKGDSVIVAEVEYDYQPLIFDKWITTTKKLEEKFYLKPRLSAFVTYDGNNCP